MNKDINFQFATIQWAGAMRGWALPGCKYTKSKKVAESVAKKINRLIMRSNKFYSFEREFKRLHK